MVILESAMAHSGKKLLFIINPVSGGKDKSRIPQLITDCVSNHGFKASFLFTRSDDQPEGLWNSIRQQDPSSVIAVGGDGTINLVASALHGTDIPLGIIPFGSGNGLGRALAIPRNLTAALLKIMRMDITRIDTASINGRRFFNVAGMGFDAHISTLFAANSTRGLRGYIQTTISELASYPSAIYKLELDGRMIERQAFMVSVANSSQYGNDMHISPEASLKDGLLDVCIVTRFPPFKLPAIAIRLRSRTAHRSRYNEIIRAKRIRIFRNEDAPVHIDGEPLFLGKDLTIEIEPLSLSVII